MPTAAPVDDDDEVGAGADDETGATWGCVVECVVIAAVGKGEVEVDEEEVDEEEVAEAAFTLVAVAVEIQLPLAVPL